jgi:hypothetical protein
MNNKNTITNILIGILIIANITTLSLYWLRKDHRPPLLKGNNRAEDFVIKELKLDSTQANAYKALVAEHRQQINNIKGTVNSNREKFFGLLKNDTINPEVFNEALKGTSVEQKFVDSITFYHFKKLRAICSPEQKKKFDEIIQQILRMNGPPRTGGPPPRDSKNGLPPRDAQGPPPDGQGPPPDDQRPPPHQ